MKNDLPTVYSDDARSIRHSIIAVLRDAADPDKASLQQAYMKSDMPFYGMGVPRSRKISKSVLRRHEMPDAAAWEALILCLWREATHREERYAAIQLLHCKRYCSWLDPVRAPLVEELVVTGAWWDYVDTIASRAVGTMLSAHPGQMRPLLRRWARDDNIWKRRTAILSQLRAKQATNTSLLTDAILPSIGESEFFLRKGIGWALREYSKTDPQWVLEFVAKNPGLSGLSRREALKHLRRTNSCA